MGGGAFLLLKTGSNGRESAEQAEIPLAGFVTFLAFGSRGEPSALPQSREGLENAFSG
jgi:hypothetical protein